MQMSLFNWVDLAIIAVIVISMLISLLRGFIREALSLASWIVSIWLGIKFSGVVGEHLKPYITTASVRAGVSFFIIFAVCLLIGTIISFIITQIIHKTGLSGTDRLLGLVFGLARGVLVVAMLLLIAIIAEVPKDSWWTSSQLIPQFQPITTWLREMLPENMQPNNLKNGKQQLLPANLTSEDTTVTTTSDRTLSTLPEATNQ